MLVQFDNHLSPHCFFPSRPGTCITDSAHVRATQGMKRYGMWLASTTSISSCQHSDLFCGLYHKLGRHSCRKQIGHFSSVPSLLWSSPADHLYHVCHHSAGSTSFGALSSDFLCSSASRLFHIPIERSIIRVVKRRIFTRLCDCSCP
jgi:hypothetical protein